MSAAERLNLLNADATDEDRAGYFDADRRFHCTDPETTHYLAEIVLLESVSPEIRDAYKRCKERTGQWWYA